jgi:general secretion pathway protein I
MIPDGAPHNAPTAGFTLLEVLVALIISIVALIGLFRVGASGLIAVDTAGRTEEAIERAQSHLAAIGRDAALAPVDAEGDDGGGFRWHVSVRQIMARQAAGGAPALAAYDVEVVISWRGGSRNRQVALQTLRLGSASSS